MVVAGAVVAEGFEVLRGAVALVLGEAVLREVLVEFDHELVPEGLGKYGGHGNGE